MTDTSIRAELRTAAEADYPWDALLHAATGVALAFVGVVEPWDQLQNDHERARWFLLLVAEAL